MLINETTAIVTGACSGLGAATAKALAARGARVFGIDLPDIVTGAPPIDGSRSPPPTSPMRIR